MTTSRHGQLPARCETYGAEPEQRAPARGFASRLRHPVATAERRRPAYAAMRRGEFGAAGSTVAPGRRHGGGICSGSTDGIDVTIRWTKAQRCSHPSQPSERVPERRRVVRVAHAHSRFGTSIRHAPYAATAGAVVATARPGASPVMTSARTAAGCVCREEVASTTPAITASPRAIGNARISMRILLRGHPLSMRQVAPPRRRKSSRIASIFLKVFQTRAAARARCPAHRRAALIQRSQANQRDRVGHGQRMGVTGPAPGRERHR